MSKQTPARGRKSAEPAKSPRPTGGGSYVRNRQTGELERIAHTAITAVPAAPATEPPAGDDVAGSKQEA